MRAAFSSLSLVILASLSAIKSDPPSRLEEESALGGLNSALLYMLEDHDDLFLGGPPIHSRPVGRGSFGLLSYSLGICC